ncbi:hypothetical protein [Hyphomicrobium sp.]|uniref:hypothetical protein n=1 Tax=Hyphomicrobium sp. TaxID=82 RepID=UPI002E338FC4|nr:hypothetical protein [Hyphomicrobium sp.]HEX2843249.1 hypothetical protein [Hyphomicrobium sp.]
MTFAKTALVATLVAATTLGASFTAANAHVKKRDARNFLYGAAAATAVVAVVKQDCKKWKYRYKRTGNPYYLDRYYACM